MNGEIKPEELKEMPKKEEKEGEGSKKTEDSDKEKEEAGENPISEEPEAEEIIDEETGERLPFPEAAVVRIMKANMDGEKMIRKEVKIAMNKWLGEMCARVSREMDKFPYVMMNLNEFKEGIKVFEGLERFDREKERILSHLDAIKKDIEKLEWDLGKREGVLEGEERTVQIDKKRKVIEKTEKIAEAT